MGDYYTWQEFKAAVREMLPIDKNRQGLQDTTNDDGTVSPGYISRMTRQAVIDLQRFVQVFRRMHETLYYPFDVVAEGQTSRGVLPPFAEIRDCYLFNTGNGVRYPLAEFPWERRHELTNGMIGMLDNSGRICIEPDANSFYIYPALTGNWVLSLNWDALMDEGKSDFADAEQVPFPEDSVFAASEFVKGHIAREINKDLGAFSSYFHPRTGTYSTARRNLWLTAKDRAQSMRGTLGANVSLGSKAGSGCGAAASSSGTDNMATATQGRLIETIDLPVGQDYGSVVFTTRPPRVPLVVIPNVLAPNGGLNIFAIIKAGSVTATGFDYALTGAPDQEGYKLSYVCEY